MVAFPANPDVGDKVVGPSGEVWEFDGVKWVSAGEGGGVSGDFLPLTGGTLTGALSMSGNEITEAVIDDGEYSA